MKPQPRNATWTGPGISAEYPGDGVTQRVYAGFSRHGSDATRIPDRSCHRGSGRRAPPHGGLTRRPAGRDGPPATARGRALAAVPRRAARPRSSRPVEIPSRRIVDRRRLARQPARWYRAPGRRAWSSRNRWPCRGQRELRGRFPDLRRRFVFEYYPWYDTDPWFHWNDADHAPPLDVTASSMPRLGAYDTYDVRVLEQHARWIADAGVGAINLSWWGRGDYTDLAVPRVMDVMRDHDIKVTFHLEPYRDDRSRNYADDLLFLLREYGEKRRWDTFLLLDDGNGRVAPVFKSFRTILPSQVQDCLGRDLRRARLHRRRRLAATDRHGARGDAARFLAPLPAGGLARRRPHRGVADSTAWRCTTTSSRRRNGRGSPRTPPTSGCSRRSTSTPGSIAIRSGSHRRRPRSIRVTAAHWGSNQAARTPTGATCRRASRRRTWRSIGSPSRSPPRRRCSSRRDRPTPAAASSWPTSTRSTSGTRARSSSRRRTSAT